MSFVLDTSDSFRDQRSAATSTIKALAKDMDTEKDVMAIYRMSASVFGIYQPGPPSLKALGGVLAEYTAGAGDWGTDLCSAVTRGVADLKRGMEDASGSSGREKAMRGALVILTDGANEPLRGRPVPQTDCLAEALPAVFRDYPADGLVVFGYVEPRFGDKIARALGSTLHNRLLVMSPVESQGASGAQRILKGMGR